jgi:hypothetical protein
MSAPTLPCPSWCNGRHPEDSSSQSHLMHRDISDHYVYVTLGMTDWGTERPGLAFANGGFFVQFCLGRDFKLVQIDHNEPAEYELWSGVLKELGREDVLAVVDELRAIATQSAES